MTGATEMQPSSPRFCPFCDEPMSSCDPVSGVTAEACPRCDAVWFDSGELRQYRRLEGVAHERGGVTRRNARWTGDLLDCPACDTRSLRTGWRGRTRIAHCVECDGYLLPSLVEARGARLMAETEPYEPGARLRTTVWLLVAIGVATLIAIAVV